MAAHLVPPSSKASQAPPSATTECRCIGAPAYQQIGDLLSLLRGMCYKYGSFQYYDMVLRAPIQGGTASTTIRLTRSMLPDPAARSPLADVLPDRWTVRVESLPIGQVRRGAVGPAAASGPEASVSAREVLESSCYSNMAHEFWQAMGAKLDYEVVRKGNEYCCLHEDKDIKVQLLQLLPLQQAGRPESARAGRDARYILDVTLRVPEDARAEGQRVLDTFAARLARHVTLGRADAGYQAAGH